MSDTEYGVLHVSGYLGCAAARPGTPDLGGRALYQNREGDVCMVDDAGMETNITRWQRLHRRLDILQEDRCCANCMWGPMGCACADVCMGLSQWKLRRS